MLIELKFDDSHSYMYIPIRWIHYKRFGIKCTRLNNPNSTCKTNFSLPSSTPRILPSISGSNWINNIVFCFIKAQKIENGLSKLKINRFVQKSKNKLSCISLVFHPTCMLYKSSVMTQDFKQVYFPLQWAK